MPILVKIPFTGKSERGESVRRCIRKAAEEMGMSQHQVALVMSHFFEAICDEVSNNHLVHVPSFGVFGPKAWQPRHDPEALPFCYPAFSGSIPFRNSVRACCPPRGAALDGIKKHRARQGNNSGHNREVRRPASAQSKFRQLIRADARKLGLKL